MNRFFLSTSSRTTFLRRHLPSPPSIMVKTSSEKCQLLWPSCLPISELWPVHFVCRPHYILKNRGVPIFPEEDFCHIAFITPFKRQLSFQIKHMTFLSNAQSDDFYSVLSVELAKLAWAPNVMVGQKKVSLFARARSLQSADPLSLEIRMIN